METETATTKWMKRQLDEAKDAIGFYRPRALVGTDKRYFAMSWLSIELQVKHVNGEVLLCCNYVFDRTVTCDPSLEEQEELDNPESETRLRMHCFLLMETDLTTMLLKAKKDLENNNAVKADLFANPAAQTQEAGSLEETKKRKLRVLERTEEAVLCVYSRTVQVQL